MTSCAERETTNRVGAEAEVAKFIRSCDVRRSSIYPQRRMKVTCKTLANEMFDINVEATATVRPSVNLPLRHASVL